MFNVNIDDESLCRMCLDKQAAPNSVFCATCDRKPSAPLLSASSATKNESTVTVRDDDGNVLYAADIPAGSNVHAAAQAMYKALEKRGYPLIDLSCIKFSHVDRKSEE